MKFRWYVDGLEDTKLSNLSSIKVSSNQKVTVDYISSYDCSSDQSDAKTIINYVRPKTPTITELTRLRYCDVELITAKLQSSLDSLRPPSYPPMQAQGLFQLTIVPPTDLRLLRAYRLDRANMDARPTDGGIGSFRVLPDRTSLQGSQVPPNVW